MILHKILYTECSFTHSVYFYTHSVFFPTKCNFTKRVWFYAYSMILRCFFPRQLLSRIYVLSSVKFPGLKLRLFYTSHNLCISLFAFVLSSITISELIWRTVFSLWAFHFWSPVVQSIHLGYKDPKSHSPLPWQQHMLLGIVKSCHEFSHFSLQLAINVQTFSPGLRNVTDMADISV